MAVERRWGKEPGWFWTHAPDTQARLLADMYLSLETPEQAKKAAQRSKRRRLDDHRDQYLKSVGRD